MRLEVRRVIRASPAALYQAWLSPEQLRRWWGPPSVACIHAEVDARVGGSYRLDNQLPNGTVVVIRGEFLTLTPPSELRYTWRVEPSVGEELVCVRFRACYRWHRGGGDTRTYRRHCHPGAARNRLAGVPARPRTNRSVAHFLKFRAFISPQLLLLQRR